MKQLSFAVSSCLYYMLTVQGMGVDNKCTVRHTHTAGSPSSIPVRQDWNRCEHAGISLSRTYSHLAQPRVSCPPRNDLDFIWGLFSLVFTLSQVNIPLLKLFSSFVFFSVQKPGMEELTIWEQHTITLNKVSVCRIINEWMHFLHDAAQVLVKM